MLLSLNVHTETTLALGRQELLTFSELLDVGISTIFDLIEQSC